ncbi:MAG: helix-turn-helix transcriptional regulator [Clostridia bacterium]|nr:helix-turn-helix transcriptional regulator [Clostridia bacterium]
MAKYDILLKTDDKESVSKLVRLKTGALDAEDMEYAAGLFNDQVVEMCGIITSGRRNLLREHYSRNGFISFEYTGDTLFDQKIETIMAISAYTTAAIEGGADLGQVYRTRYLHVLKTINAESMDSLFNYLREFISDYCRLVTLAKEDQEKSHIVRKVNALIQDCTEPKISGEMISEKLGMNPQYVRRKYRELAGITIDQAFAEFKISSARIMLLNRSISISEIAAGLGYASLSHFYKAFTRISGMTPGEYRSKHIKK